MVFLSIKPPSGANSRLGCASNLMVIGPAAVVQRDEAQYLRPSFAGLCGDARDKCRYVKRTPTTRTISHSCYEAI